MITADFGVTRRSGGRRVWDTSSVVEVRVLRPDWCSTVRDDRRGVSPGCCTAERSRSARLSRLVPTALSRSQRATTSTELRRSSLRLGGQPRAAALHLVVASLHSVYLGDVTAVAPIRWCTSCSSHCVASLWYSAGDGA